MNKHTKTSPIQLNQVGAIIVLLAIATTVFVLDQWTKYLVVSNIKLFESWAPVPAFSRVFQFTRTFNTGAAFGMFPNMSNFFLIIAVAVILFIVYYVATNKVLPLIVVVSLGLQAGGAIGNLADRISRGAVVDFVDIGFWPIFNIADISVVLGVLILAIWLWREDEKKLESYAAAE